MEVISVNPNIVIVKINREQQRKHRDMINGLYLNPNQVFLKQNLQHGEIVKSGEDIQRTFPNLSLGDILIFHHFIEGSMQNNSANRELNVQYLFNDEDPVFRYYIVPKEQIYGLLSGNTITTYPGLVLAEKIEETQGEEIQNGVFVIRNYKESAEHIDYRLEKLRQEAMQMNKYAKGNPHVIRAIEEKEKEMAAISRNLNKKKFTPFKIHHTNSEHPELLNNVVWYSYIGEAPTSITFKEKEFFVLRTKHISFIQKSNGDTTQFG